MNYKKINDNKYRLIIDKMQEGERYYKSKTITTDLKDMELEIYLGQEYLKLQQELMEEKRLSTNLHKLTYEEYVEYFLENHTLAQTTKESYRAYLLRTHALDFFQGKIISKITETDINVFFKKLSTLKSKITGEPFRHATIKQYHAYLSIIFNHAIEHKAVTETPVKLKLPSPKKTLNTNKFYHPSEIEEISKKLKEYGDLVLETYFHLSINLGTRPSESRGLQWKKVDFKKRVITIDEALVSTVEKGYIMKPTKTEDTRVQHIPNYLYYLLEKLYKFKQKQLGKIDLSDVYVLSMDDGEYIKYPTQRYRWETFCKKYNLRFLRPYSLRHSSGTLLAFNNVPLANISKHLGHSHRSTTEVYIHATKEGDEQIKEVMEDISPSIRLVK